MLPKKETRYSVHWKLKAHKESEECQGTEWEFKDVQNFFAIKKNIKKLDPGNRGQVKQA